MTALVSFIVLRSSREPVTDPAEAEPVLQALLGPLDGLVRMVESDGLIGGWLTEASEEEAAHLRTCGAWVAGGVVDGLDYVCAAEMP
ncbi:MAG: hypothetical protein WAL12_20945 [Trebonia sp.]